MNINRADNRCPGAGDNWYNSAVHGQAAMEEEMHYVTCGMMNTTTSTSELVMYDSYDAFGWAKRPGFMNVPAAAPLSPVPPSNDVKNIMANMVLLRGMGPEQAARILKHTAACRGRTKTEERGAPCTNVGTLCGIMDLRSNSARQGYKGRNPRTFGPTGPCTLLVKGAV